MLARNFFMLLAGSKTMKSQAVKWAPKLGVDQVIAGENIEEAIGPIRRLNEQGMSCTGDFLGEFVYDREDAIASANQSIKALKGMVHAGVDCNLSVKLTSLGLDVDRNLCRDNMVRILEEAKKSNTFVRIDMEDYGHLDATLDILHELRQSYDKVGTAIQSYLFRAEKDVRDLKGVNLRLIKGAYKESPQVAYQKKSEVDENFLNIIRVHLLNGSYAAIATHDHHVIEEVKVFAKENGIPRDQFEFQMLYGFRSELQKEIADEGYKVRIYVPFGDDWYGYYMRRLAERPQNVRLAVQGIFSK